MCRNPTPFWCNHVAVNLFVHVLSVKKARACSRNGNVIFRSRGMLGGIRKKTGDCFIAQFVVFSLHMTLCIYLCY